MKTVDIVPYARVPQISASKVRAASSSASKARKR